MICSISKADISQTWKAIALLAAVLVLVIVIRVTGPSDLNQVDQPLVAAYVADILDNGNYIVQYDHQGLVATKPPLYNWISALIIRLRGGPSEFVLKLPSVLAAFGTLILTFLLARMWLEPRLAMAAALMLASGHHFFKMAYLARTDMLLCFLILLSIYAFERSRNLENPLRWNLLFWVIQGLATLTKGPAGPAMVHVYVFGRLALEKDFRGYLRLGALWGIPIWICISLAWLLPACRQGGVPFVERVLKGEIISRLQGVGPRAKEVRPFYAFFPWFMARFLPWSLLAAAALFQNGRSSPWRAQSPLIKVVLWLVTMMLLLSLIPSKRADWLLPVYPAGAILAAYLFLQLSTLTEKPIGRVVCYSRILFLLLSGFLLGAGVFIIIAVLCSPFLPAEVEAVKSVINRASPILTLAVGIFLVLGGGVAWRGMRNFKVEHALGGLLVCLFATNFIYYHTLTTPAVTRDGSELKHFMGRVSKIIPPGEKVIFGSIRSPAQFFLLKNQRPADYDTIRHAIEESKPFWLLIRNQELEKFPSERDYSFEILLSSRYSKYEEDRLTLARWPGKKPIKKTLQ